MTLVDDPIEIMPPPRRRGGRTWLRVVLAVGIAGLLAVAGTAVWVQGRINPSGPPGEAIQITIPPGSSTARIAAILDDEGVITSAQLFKAWLRLRGGGPFQAGNYEFRLRSSFGETLDALNEGPEHVLQRLTVPEGLTLGEVAERVARLPGRSAERFLAAAASGEVRSRFQPPGVDNLEGLLYPDTYFVREDDDERAILERMVTTFDEVATEVGIEAGAEALGLTPYEAIVAASLIEEEAKVAADRTKISRVIQNRLERDMLLQIDATVIYALGGHKTRVLFSDLEVDSPYNTYKRKGLPPTPIAGSGRASLAAAVEPEPGPWLFYVVVQADGTHAFAETGEEHARNIRLAEQRGLR